MIGDTYKAKNSIYRVKCNNAGIIRKYDVQGTNENQYDNDDYSDAPMQKKTTCTCHEAVGSRQHKNESAFLTLRDRGDLFKPAECHRSMH